MNFDLHIAQGEGNGSPIWESPHSGLSQGRVQGRQYTADLDTVWHLGWGGAAGSCGEPPQDVGEAEEPNPYPHHAGQGEACVEQLRRVMQPLTDTLPHLWCDAAQENSVRLAIGSSLHAKSPSVQHLGGRVGTQHSSSILNY